ncbi:serine/threonine-protein kinase [Kribbella sp. NPDC055071]
MRRVGEVIAGRYQVVAPIGRGGMGEVYRATDLVLSRDVAVKVLLPIPETLAARERFLREARASARLRHPHVVAAYDFGRYGAACFLAMELVQGRTLGQELKRVGPLPADRAEQLIRQAAAGLAAAHAQGLVHRDIKPDNLLLTGDGCVKVADFGIVRFLDDATTTMTAGGQIIGTSHYLSPERVLGQPAEPASDVYALGCVLYQLVTGRPPFVSDNPASVMFQHVQREPTPPRKLQPELPAEIEALTLWMLSKGPEERPTAAEVASGVRPSVVTRAEADLTTTAVLPGRRKVLRPVLLGVAALAVCATFGVLSGATDLQLPATSDLSPSDVQRTTPPTVPPSSKPPTPTVARTVVRTTTSRPSAAPTATAKPSASRPAPTKPQPGKPAKPDKHGPSKPKKPKP